MTMAPPPRTVVPYAQFLERREQRDRVASELRRQEAQRTIDALDVVVAAETPGPDGQKYRQEGSPKPAQIGASDLRPHER